MTDSRWRAHAAPIIHRVLAETAGKSEPEIAGALRAAYPFGERKYHPYKIWLDEVRKQRSMKPSKYATAEEHYAGRVAEIRAHNAAVEAEVSRG